MEDGFEFKSLRPHLITFFNPFVPKCVSATLKDRLLDWLPLRNKKKVTTTGRTVYTLSDYHLVHCNANFSVWELLPLGNVWEQTVCFNWSNHWTSNYNISRIPEDKLHFWELLREEQPLQQILNDSYLRVNLALKCDKKLNFSIHFKKLV